MFVIKKKSLNVKVTPKIIEAKLFSNNFKIHRTIKVTNDDVNN